MNQYDFNTYTLDSNESNDGFVVLHAGKGKKKSNSLKIDSKAFSYVEGILWDKHREYGDERKTRIFSSEWSRIIEGFKEAITELKTINKTDDIEGILKFDIIGEKQPLEDLLGRTDELALLLENIVEWVEHTVKKERYILIIKPN